MICLETGKVIEFVDPIIEQRQHEIAEEHGFDIEDHSLIMYVRPKKK
jgi:Fur family ferric uptake transcriptional regulator